VRVEQRRTAGRRGRARRGGGGMRSRLRSSWFDPAARPSGCAGPSASMPVCHRLPSVVDAGMHRNKKFDTVQIITFQRRRAPA
jgi:hypothetical protein